MRIVPNRISHELHDIATPAVREPGALGDSPAKPGIARKFHDNALGFPPGAACGRYLGGEPLRSRQLPLPHCVCQMGHALRRFRADRIPGHAARVHALEQADSGAEQHR
jgi:hypothetical protein